MQIVTDENDIFFYFEMIRQVRPESVLDHGMFLRSIGALSRSVRDMRFSEDICLVGVDTDPVCGLGIYETVYDRIVTPYDMFMSQDHYSLALIMMPEETGLSEPMETLQKRYAGHVDHVGIKIINPSVTDRLKKISSLNVRPVSVGRNVYALISFDR